jgi:hypothetical protein
MQLYRVELTSGLTDGGTEVESFYYASFTQARSFCNQAIRASLSRWKQYDHVKRLADVAWGEKIVITSVKTAKMTTRSMVLLILNHGDRIPEKLFVRESIVQQWNPQDKWHKPQSRGEE